MMSSMPGQPAAQVTAVIPAYNEADHIERLLTVLRDVSQIKQIMVVDDASIDETAAVAARCQVADPRIRVIRLAKNRGKGGAIMAGIQASNPDLLLFLDADLLRLQAGHVESLIAPVREGTCAMALGLFKNGRRQTNWTHRIFYFLSGQRCLRWSAFRNAAAFADARWGIEMAFNLIAWQRDLPVAHVPWQGVTHVMRLEKMNGLSKYWTYVEMWADILKFMAKFGWKQWIVNGRSAKWMRQTRRQITLSD